MTDSTILVPLDGSTFAEWALPSALSLAERLDMDIELVSVYFDDPLMAEWEVATEALGRFHTEYVNEVADRVRAASQVSVATTVLSGDVGPVLARHVKDAHAQIVVMSTHGRGPVSRAWLGSVADYLLRHIHVPMLLVRPSESGTADLAQRPTFNHVLVALDGSSMAEAILPLASKIVRSFRGQLSLVRAIAPHFAPSPYLPYALSETHAALERGRESADAYFASVKEQLAPDLPTVDSHVALGTPPATAIVTFADTERVDLIAIATHGRGGVRRMLLGSVADKVLRSSATPVLVTRP